MYSLARQVGEANRHAVLACALLAGLEAPAFPDASRTFRTEGAHRDRNQIFEKSGIRRDRRRRRQAGGLQISQWIGEVVSKIKDSGYDIFLVLEATIGVSKPGEKSDDKTSLVTTLTTNPEFKISDQDLKFLKSLRIKIENDAA